MRWLGENEIPFALVFTKMDKLGKVNLQKSLDHYREVLKSEWDELPVQFLTSSISGEGKDGILDYVRQINGG
jgi:GTP-binding protein